MKSLKKNLTKSSKESCEIFKKIDSKDNDILKQTPVSKADAAKIDKKVLHSSKELLDLIVKTCDDAKGDDITALDVKESFGLSDYFVIVSARSERQVQGICSRVIKEVSMLKVHPISVEGLNKGDWALVDFGDVVLHVFYEAVRSEYDLESLWKKAKEVKLNLK